MDKEFIPYEQASALKELGFDERCFGFYENETLKPTSYVNDFNHGTNHNVDFNNVFKTILAPTFSQAFRWLYQKLDIEKGVMPLDIESQQLLLRELIYKVSSKHLLV